ncbi:ewing's tumor-associated antigen 1 [Bufo bufo]|uniref:ewing's tumor-associated antigen 1 n=1 Tax=Bufo bufo TaxID=8384 RepID=UPI001ABE8FB8|nr:ewing's tumor-associated antigen 1 [Bufo bufo]
MTSRRRQPGDRSRLTCEDGDRGERKVPKERAGDSDRETPKKPSKKASRTRRSGSSRLCSQTSSCVAPTEEELFSNKKTPRQYPRSKLWTSTFNSPSNDADQQQDIFWDPHSPTTYKLENGKRKLAANKCTVDISDIVNRIAPKNEKPSNSEAAYLGIWIGDDAIPCTPLVARSKTKIQRSRILQTEEELMKLAKQLDSNLVKQKDQNEEQLANSEYEMFSERNAMDNKEDSFLEDLPEEDEMNLVLKSVSQRSAPQGSSQRSVDQDVEAALNDLFDSSTQKYSGRLSQGLSDVSISSVNKAPVNVRSNVHEDIGHSKKEQCSEKLKKSEHSSSASKISTNKLQSVKKCHKQNNGKEKETVQSVSSSQDDFEDDWGHDLLDDDSFIMQVTQNPELIATPKNTMPSSKLGQSSTHLAGGEDKSTAISSSFSKTSNYKFVPRKGNVGSETKPSNLRSKEVTSVNSLQGSSRDTNNVKSFSSTQTRVPSKPQTNAAGQVISNNVHSLAPATNSTLMKSSQKPCAPTVPQTRTMTANKDSVPHDEWDDLQFSDEVLDMFCDSDSLWEEKEDDDDLLYQVCDDVERLTQAYETTGENPEKETPLLTSTTCQIPAKQGTNASHQNRNGSHVTASSSFGTNKLNNRGVSPASFSGNCLNAFKISSLQKSNQTLSRSCSVPSGGERKSSVVTSPQSQNPGKSLGTTCSLTNPSAPSKFSFTKIKPSQVTSVHTAHSVAGSWSSYNGLHSQTFGGSRSNRDTLVRSNSDSVSNPQQSTLKRHLSESTLQSSKVFVSEDHNKKCSMEEIERKKQEALARRKMKARASSGDIAPT